MEPKLLTTPAATCEAVLDTAAGHPIECEILLPDYCPDLMRVLTCRAEADVTKTAVRGTALSVEGTAAVTLLYLGEVGGIRRAEQRVPFVHTFELPREVSEPVVFASAQREELSCRASSRRRIEVRGTLSVRAAVCAAGETPVVSGTETAGLYLCLGEQTLPCVRRCVRIPFAQMESVIPPPGNQPPHEVLRADCAAVLSEWSAAGDGIVLRGGAHVRLLCATEAG